MSQMTPAAEPAEAVGNTMLLALRGAVGGTLMGLANLVPGISGGTMLLAAGVYPDFVDAIAELSRLRVRMRPVVVLGTIAASAAISSVRSIPTGHQVTQRPQPTHPDEPNWSCQVTSLCSSHCR